MELVDAYNEDNEKVGITCDRWEAFEKGYWKRAVSCWIMNRKGEVLLQKRSCNKKRNPNKWSKTGGQVDAGESVEEGVKREVKEELGIDIPDSMIDIKQCRFTKNEYRKMFMYSFIFIVDYDIEDFVIQEEELSEIKYYTIEEISRQRELCNRSFVFYNWSDRDFFDEIALLMKARDKAKGGITTMDEMRKLIDINRNMC